MTVNTDKDIEGKEIVDEEEVKVDKTGIINLLVLLLLLLLYLLFVQLLMI